MNPLDELPVVAEGIQWWIKTGRITCSRCGKRLEPHEESSCQMVKTKDGWKVADARCAKHEHGPLGKLVGFLLRVLDV